MDKKCSKCQQPKPLTAEYWLPRKESIDGYRGVCRACWYAQQNINKRRHYQRNAERLCAERRHQRQIDPETFRRRDALYNVRHADKRKVYNQAYYRRNRERILKQKAEQSHLRPLSLDYGWQDDLKHDRLPFMQWSTHETMRDTIDALLAKYGDSDDCDAVESVLRGEIDFSDKRIVSLIERIKSNVPTSNGL